MADKENKAFYCTSCESRFSIIYDPDSVYTQEPEVCPFCSECMDTEIESDPFSDDPIDDKDEEEEELPSGDYW